MKGSRFTQPIEQPARHAKLRFRKYVPDGHSDELQVVFEDAELTRAHRDPVVADQDGFFPPIFVGPEPFALDVIDGRTNTIAMQTGPIKFNDPDTVAPPRRHLNLSNLAAAIATERGADLAVVILVEQGMSHPTIKFGRSADLSDATFGRILASVVDNVLARNPAAIFEERASDASGFESSEQVGKGRSGEPGGG